MHLTARQTPESGDRIGRLGVLQTLARSRAAARWAETHEAKRAEAAVLTAKMSAEALGEDDEARLAALVTALHIAEEEKRGLYREVFAEVCREWGEEPPAFEDVRWWTV